MKITYSITEEDLKKYVSSDFSAKNKTIPKLLLFIGGFALIAILLLALIAKDYSFAIPIIVFLVVIYLILKSPKLLKKKYLNKIDTKDERIIEIDENHLTVTNSTRTTSYKFNEIEEVTFVNDYFIFIRFNPGDSLLIPKTAFSDSMEMIGFINKIKVKSKIL
jgi:hypothetical protein